MPSNPNKFYLLIALILSACIGIALWYCTPIHPLWIYLLTLTLITFAFYGYDKYQSTHQGNRIPEVVLHLLALAGGTIGAVVGQLFFRHKTKKFKFRVILGMIILIQVGLILLWSYRESF